MPEYIEKHYEEGHYEHGPANQYQTDCFAYANRVKMDMYKRYGVLGAAGDRHLAEFMNASWYLKNPKQVEAWKFALTTVDFRIYQMNEKIKESKEMADGILPVKVQKSDEEAVDLMRAVLGLTSTISNVNIINKGQIDWLPKGSIVESNAIFTNNNVNPIMTKPLPKSVQVLVKRCCDNVDVLYEGIKNRDMDMVFAAFINQPLCSCLTINESRTLFEEMLAHTKH